MLTYIEVVVMHHTRAVTFCLSLALYFEEFTKKQKVKQNIGIFFLQEQNSILFVIFLLRCFWCWLEEQRGLDTKTRQPRYSYYALGNAVNFTSLHLSD